MYIDDVIPSGHTTNLRRRHDVVDSSQRRRRFVVMLHPYDVAGRRIATLQQNRSDVAILSPRRSSFVVDSVGKGRISDVKNFRRSIVVDSSKLRHSDVADSSKFIGHFRSICDVAATSQIRQNLSVIFRPICDVADSSKMTNKFRRFCYVAETGTLEKVGALEEECSAILDFFTFPLLLLLLLLLLPLLLLLLLLLLTTMW